MGISVTGILSKRLQFGKLPGRCSRAWSSAYSWYLCVANHSSSLERGLYDDVAYENDWRWEKVQFRKTLSVGHALHEASDTAAEPDDDRARPLPVINCVYESMMIEVLSSPDICSNSRQDAATSISPFNPRLSGARSRGGLRSCEL